MLVKRHYQSTQQMRDHVQGSFNVFFNYFKIIYFLFFKIYFLHNILKQFYIKTI